MVEPDKKKKPKSEESKFSLERLRKDCYKIFGITQSTFDGAFLGLDGEFTVSGAKDIIEKWQKTQVEPAKKKEGK